MCSPSPSLSLPPHIIPFPFPCLPPSKKTKKDLHDIKLTPLTAHCHTHLQENIKRGHNKYLESHPEVSSLLNDFLSAALLEKPKDVYAFATKYFTPYNSGTVDLPPLGMGYLLSSLSSPHLDPPPPTLQYSHLHFLACTRPFSLFFSLTLTLSSLH
jgi:hypothetical protein